MRRRSIVGPLILVAIGGLFLWNNLRPDVPVFDLVARYWPFLLIAWGSLRLAEILYAAVRSQPLPRGLSGGEVVLIVFLCIVGTGMFQAHRHGWRFGPRGLDVFGEQYDYTVSGQKPAPAVKHVAFENLRGNLRITGGDAQEIRVTGRKMIRAFRRYEADEADRNTPLEIVVEGDRAVVRTNQDRVSGERRVSEDLEVTVPRAAAVEARGRWGDLDITEIAGNVEISADRADVRLSKIGGSARLDVRRSDIVRAVDVKGNIDLQGRGSDIELENVAGQVTVNGSYAGTLEFKNLAKPLHFESQNTDLRVEALPGRITMDLSELTARNLVGPVRLVTKSKDVRIEEFTQTLEVETERGDIELTPAKLPLAKMDVRSRTGKIDLVLPDKAAFQLKATAERGDALNDFGPAIQKESSGHSASLTGKVGQGPVISLVTERGTVSVRKAGTAPKEAKL